MRWRRGALGLCLCVALLVAGGASAQAPVCAPPSETQVFYTRCAPGLAPKVLRFLLDLSIEHSFKIVPERFSRSFLDFARLVSEEEIPEDSELYRILHDLPSIDMTRLDTSTGTFSADLAGRDREISVTADMGFALTNAVSLRLPERLAGGYWRTPAALELAFWDRRRATFAIDSDPEGSMARQIECVSISTSGVRVVTADPSAPQFLLLFGNCR